MSGVTGEGGPRDPVGVGPILRPEVHHRDLEDRWVPPSPGRN